MLQWKPSHINILYPRVSLRGTAGGWRRRRNWKRLALVWGGYIENCKHQTLPFQNRF